MNAFLHLCRYINRQFTIPTPGIEMYHRLHQDLGLSTIEVTEVIVFMELLYEVTLPNEDLTPSLSVKQLCTLIEQYSDNQKTDSTFQVYRNSSPMLSKVS